MARLVYPLILENMIKDEHYDPPFVVLKPKTSKFKKEEGESVEVSDKVNGKSTVAITKYTKEKDKLGVESTTGETITEIILPMPPQLTDSLTSNFQQVEGMGKLSEGVGSYLKWKGFKMLSSLGGLLPQEVALAVKSGIFGGAIDNPYDKMLYSGHNRRSFQLAYEDLKPISRSDEDVLKQIIDIMKSSSVGSYGSYVILGPPSWDIEFHSSIGVICLSYDTCQIAGFEERMGGQGEGFARMDSGFPITGFSMTFNEMGYVTPDKLKRY